MQPFIFLLVASLFFVLPLNVHGQNIKLRYGQIPSTLKTVSALQFHLAHDTRRSLQHRLRRAGFTEAMYSEDMFRKWFARYQLARLIPPRA